MCSAGDAAHGELSTWLVGKEGSGRLPRGGDIGPELPIGKRI